MGDNITWIVLFGMLLAFIAFGPNPASQASNCPAPIPVHNPKT